MKSNLIRNAIIIGTYVPLPWEPDIAPLWSYMGFERFAFPKVDPQNRILRFYRVTSLADLSRGYAGIIEPRPGCPEFEPWPEASVILVPGLGFDLWGARVGSGLGFYDRFLKTFIGIKIGVAFKEQIHSIPLEQEYFDVKVSFLASEEGIFEAKKDVPCCEDKSSGS